MSLASLLTPLVAISAVIFIVRLAASIIGANLYDLKNSGRLKKIKAKKPLITVLIKTKNSETAITDCLNSVIKGSTRKLEILIVDQASSDNTKQLVRDFINSHPKNSIRLVATQQTSINPKALKIIVNKHAKGELIFEMSADMSLDTHALKEASYAVINNPDIIYAQPKLKIRRGEHISQLLLAYLSFLSVRQNKLNTWLGISRQEAPLIYGKGLSGHRPEHVQYLDNCIVYVNSSSSISLFKLQLSAKLNLLSELLSTRKLWTLAVGESLTTIFMPVLFSYSIYLAFSLHEPTLLSINCGLLALFLLMAIWQDRAESLIDKFKYSLAIPISFVLLYIFSLLQMLTLLAKLLLPELFVSNGKAQL